MFYYNAQAFPSKVIIVGCGGTGSRLVPLVAQFLKTVPYVISPEIHLIDGDVVEEKNLQRQLFVSQDVGKNKATVLANRYSKAYNINIFPHEIFLNKDVIDKVPLNNSGFHLTNFVGNIYRTPVLIILCVDSGNARREVLATLSYPSLRMSSSSILIDCGNENDFGQVKIMNFVLTYSNDPDDAKIALLRSMPDKVPVDYQVPFIPFDFAYFGDMQDKPSEASCADLDQTLAINSLVANTAFGIIQNIYFNKRIYGLRYNISLDHGTTLEYINWKPFKDTIITQILYENSRSMGVAKDLSPGIAFFYRVLSLLNYETALLPRVSEFYETQYRKWVKQQKAIEAFEEQELRKKFGITEEKKMPVPPSLHTKTGPKKMVVKPDDITV
jgi:hypothetical protein